MIAIEPTIKDIGRSVIYQGGHPDDKDEGVITSLGGGGTVFVRYRSQHPSAHGQATSRHDLEWAHPE